MDYLSLLPVELWSRIIEIAVDLGATCDWPPSNELRFLLLDRTYAQPGDYSTYDAKSRSQIRLVCSSFKMMVDRRVPAQPGVIRSDLSTQFSDLSLGTSVTTLIVRLEPNSPDGPNAKQRLRNLWSSGPSLPNLRALTLDELSVQGLVDLWEPLSKAFPQIESLALRPTHFTALKSTGLSTVTLERLRHLYMPRILSVDLPVLPNLRMVRLGRGTSWNVQERTPSLETVCLSNGSSYGQVFLRHPRIRHVEFSVPKAYTADPWGINPYTNIELFVFTTDRYGAAIATEIELEARKYSPKSMHLNFTGTRGLDKLVEACAKRNVFFDQIHLPASFVGSPGSTIEQGRSL